MIYYHYMDLIFAVKGYTTQDIDGNYHIFINTRYCREQQERTIRHELNHITKGDFDKVIPAHLIERGA